MNGFTYEGHHFTWDEATGYYWNDDMGGLGILSGPAQSPGKLSGMIREVQDDLLP